MQVRREKALFLTRRTINLPEGKQILKTKGSSSARHLRCLFQEKETDPLIVRSPIRKCIRRKEENGPLSFIVEEERELSLYRSGKATPAATRTNRKRHGVKKRGERRFSSSASERAQQHNLFFLKKRKGGRACLRLRDTNLPRRGGE